VLAALTAEPPGRAPFRRARMQPLRIAPPCTAFAIYALRPLHPFGCPKGTGLHALRRTRRGEGGAPKRCRAPRAAHTQGGPEGVRAGSSTDPGGRPGWIELSGAARTMLAAKSQLDIVEMAIAVEGAVEAKLIRSSCDPVHQVGGDRLEFGVGRLGRGEAELDGLAGLEGETKGA